MIKRILVLCLIFAFGWVCNTAYSAYFDNSPSFNPNSDLQAFYIDSNSSSEESHLNINQLVPFISSVVGVEAKELASPHDWIKEEQIKVYGDRVIIELKNAEWAAFTDTNSMDPIIDSSSNAIELVPKSAEDIHIGDLVSYKSEYAEGTIIHRVVKKDVDGQGVYFIMKGDNNPSTDPGKIRFSQIQRVVVAIIY